MATNELPTSPQADQSNQTVDLAKSAAPEALAPQVVPEPVVEFRVRVKDVAVSRVESGVTQETEIAKTTGTKFFPRTPYYVDEKSKDVVQPSFVMGDQQARRSGDLASQFLHSTRIISLSGTEVTSLKPQEAVLIALPVAGDSLTIFPGKRVEGVPFDSLSIFAENGQFFVKDAYGNVTPLPAEFHIATHEEKVREKVITAPVERQGEITEKQELLKKDTIALSGRVVTVDGVVAVMMEGIEGTSAQVGRATLDNIKTHYEKQAKKAEQFNNGVLVSTPSLHHPTRNEDAVFRTADGISVVLDGMGSYAAGGIRTGYEHSRLAQAVIQEVLAGKGPQKDPNRQQEVFVNALIEAHNVLARNLSMKGDTTAVLSKVFQDKKHPQLVWANIGDSRVVVIRQGEVIPVTQDDSILTDYFHGKPLDTWIDVGDKTKALELFEAGFPYDSVSGKVYFSRKQVALMQDILDRFHGFGMFASDSFLSQYYKDSSVTRGLKGSMTNPRTDIHTGVMNLQRGDIVLTMSDGVSDPLSREDLELIARKNGVDPQRLATAILSEVARVNASPSQYSQRHKEDDKSLVIEVVA